VRNPIDTPQKKIVLAVAIVLVALTWWSLQPEPGSPEAICRGAVEELIAAAEAREIGPFREWISEEVQDESGRDKRQIIMLLRGIFLRYQNISLTTVSLNVDRGTNPDLVDARLTLFMSESALPQDKGSFELTFRREGSSWRIWQLAWEEGAVYGL